jgi:hypothetical protein
MGKLAGLFAGVGLALAVGLGTAARAENRTFIIPNNPDGYGLDRCLANGEPCGATVATSYCQSQSFAQARSFQKVGKDEITGAVPASAHNACLGNCESYVAIVCSR